MKKYIAAAFSILLLLLSRIPVSADEARAVRTGAFDYYPAISYFAATLGGVMIIALAFIALLKRQIQRPTADILQSKAVLLESETKFRSYIDHSPDGIFVTDENGRCLEVNPAAAAITGYSHKIVIFDKAEFISRSMGDLELSRYVATIFIENAPEYVETIRNALAAQDAVVLRQSAHKLKGAAATMALPLLAETAQLLEEIAGTGEMERTTVLLPELVKRFEQALKALNDLLITPSGTPPP